MTKSRRGVQSWHGALWMLLASCLVATTAFAGRISLDLRAPDATSPQQGGGKKLLKAAAPARDGVLRQGKLSAGATKVRPVNVGDILEFQLFEGVQIELTLTEQTESLFGTRSFLAAVTGYDGVRNAVVVESKDGLQVDVQNYKTGKVYTIYSDANGVTVKEIDPSAGTTIPTALPVPQNMVSSAADEADAVSSLATAATGDTRLDILVAFDKNARSYADLYGGGMTNFAQVAVQKMNAVLANTGLTDSFRFRLVGVMAVNAEADDVYDALHAIRDNKEGWAAVQAKRDEVGADIVTTLVGWNGVFGGASGVGWALTAAVSSFAEHAYNVCDIQSVEMDHTMIHECGHNLGAGHSDRQATEPGPQLYDYSAGYYFTAEGKSYCTVMAYESDGQGKSYATVPYFSSPDYTYLGVPVGDAKHDNTRTLQNTFAAASAWRAQVVPTTYDVLFLPTNRTVFCESVSVTLTSSNPDAVIRYTTDGSDPTVVSPVYSGPIHLKESAIIRAIAVEGNAGGVPYEAMYFKINSEGNLTIPVGMTRIGYGAFKDFCGLKSVTIPPGVTSIGQSAFEGCCELKSVTIPPSVRSIETCAFADCSELSSATLPEGVTSIGLSAFFGCSGLKSVTIPSSVTNLDFQAFYGCSGLVAATIREGVTSIGNSAFEGCSGLKSVTIPLSVTNIESGAFEGCSGLTSVTIPSSVTSIGSSAFEGCSGLTSLTIPEGVTSIGSSAFEGCSGLKSVTIPSSVTSIGRSAFYECSGLESVTIPSSMTSIGDYAFCGCSGLTLVTISDGVTSIGSWAFCGCSGLTSVMIPSSVTSIGMLAFSGCSGLTSVTIPPSVTSIGELAFGSCRSLSGIIVDVNSTAFCSEDGIVYNKSKTDLLLCPSGKSGAVTIPSSVTSIGYGAFYGCDGLTSVTIPSSVTSIGNSAFNGCSGLTSVTVPSCVTRLSYTFPAAYTRIKEVVICEGVTSIGSYEFDGCSGLQSVMIPSSVTSIGSHAFRGCRGFESVTIPSCVTSLSDTFPEAYTRIKEVVICDGVTSIGDDAFRGCTGLASVTIPSSVTSIAGSAFYCCGGLKSVEIPSSVTSIGDWAFYGCSGLTSVTIPEGVTSIGRDAFYGCSGLTSVTIPSSVTSIEDWTFLGCSGLTSVTIPSSVTSIGDYAFNGCSGLTSVTISSSVTNIGNSAFAGCSGLTSVTIPSSVTKLSDTFGSAYWQIREVIICDGVTSIGNYAFYLCRGLESVTIPSSVTSIGSSAFLGCSGLKSIVVDLGDANRVAGLLGASGFSIGKLTFEERRDPSIVIAPEVLPAGRVGEAYSVPLTVSGGKSPYVWSVRLNGAAGTSIEYIEETELSTFSSIGAAQGWRGDDSCWTYELPFAFSFFGNAYSKVYVGSNGTLTFDGAFSGFSESVQELNKHAMIAPLWDDLNTGSGDIYVSGDNESVTFRWHGSYYSGGDVNFAATLFADGMIRLSYGSGNANGGLIGISAGDGENFLVASRSQTGHMHNAGDIVFRQPASDIPVRVGLPKGVTLSADGVLSGIPTEVSSNVFTVAVTDANGNGNLREYTVVITGREAPTVEGDEGATVTGDLESGFVIKPSAEKTAVEVTIPQGVDPAKVTVEVSPKVTSVKANGAKVKIVSGGVDITEFLAVPAADGNGVVDLTQATVKEEIVREALDVEKGAVVELNTAKPMITTTKTKPGLVYTFREGTTLDGFGTKAPSATKIGDGTKWSPEITVKGGNAAFYSIGVGKGE